MRLKTFISKHSVTAQVILLITILIFPINLIALVFASQVRHAFLSENVESVSRAAEIFMNELDRRIYYADIYSVTEVDKNPYVLRLRKHTKGEPFIKDADFYWQQLHDKVTYALDADGFFFYLQNEAYMNVALNSNYNRKRKYVQQYLLNICEEDYTSRWICRSIQDDKWMIHIFCIGSYYYGSLINLSDLEEKFLASLSMKDAQVSFRDSNVEAKQKGKNIITVKSERADIYMHILLSKQVLESQIPLAKQIWFLIPFIFLACIPFIVIVLNQIVIKPIKRINRAMAELESGNTNFRIKADGENKESVELNQRFNSMAEQLNQLKIQIYESELEQRDIEATNLRLQVNPHFIVNCLNIIYSLARSGKSNEIKSFTKYMADYLRFSLWHTNGMILISEEMRCVENYLEIQKIRFPGTFSYIQDIEPALMHEQIPSLLILNFIENAIKHGMNMGSEIEIIVIARIEDDSLYISICDTGNGMTKEMLHHLREGEIPEDERGKHIGIWNCKRRLKMLYQDKAYINITSSLGEGTQVFIKVPVRGEKIEYSNRG